MTVQSGSACASFHCRRAGTIRSFLVITTEVGTSTDPIHSCEVKWPTACAVDSAVSSGV
jgi:hypothetical protein